MQLIRLRLEHWRGVAAQEVAFDPGVTLIEGPNEIGKSSLIEGLNLLFRELDSSKKADVRAVQPAGSDVGSSVVAEVRTGPYHFTYRKTFNRRPATALDIHAPRREQLTGREAHERAWAILNETIDTGLWQAIQVEQGKAVAQASLKDSQGLARALDAAAGTHGADDDSALYERVLAEYTRYYTERTGRARFADLEAEVAHHEERLEQARNALEAVEQDVQRHAGLTRELAGLERTEPELQSELAKAEEVFAALTALQTEFELAQSRLAHAELAAKTAAERWQQREQLNRRIATERAQLVAGVEQLAPLAEAARTRRRHAEALIGELQTAEAAAQLQAHAVRRAEADLEHVRDRGELERLQLTLERLAQIRAAQADASRRLTGARIDEATLARMRTAQAAYREALARLEAAAPTVEVAALAALALRVNDETHKLAAGQRTTADAASELRLQIGELATVTIRPAGEVTDLNRAVQVRHETFAALLQDFGVEDVDAAAAKLRSRQDAAVALDQAKARERELLQGASAVELEAQREALRSGIDAHLAQRQGVGPLPASLAEAHGILAEARTAHGRAEQEREHLRAQHRTAVEEAHGAETACERAEQELRGKRGYLASLEAQLEAARRDTADALLMAEAEHARRTFEAAALARETLAGKLKEQAPETVEALRDNARQALQRHREETRKSREARAGVAARLEQAQAQGLFEQLSLQQAALEAAQERLAHTHRRAAAAARLWQTLNHYRQLARRAYVRPLTERIEQLGRIVFGPDFAIEMDDELTVLSRTLEGQTVPFEALSVGAREQLGILARLAAAQLVSPEGGVPLILDDSLGYADPERLRTMGAVIAQAGKICQVVVLTCTPGRFMHVGNAKVVRL